MVLRKWPPRSNVTCSVLKERRLYPLVLGAMITVPSAIFVINSLLSETWPSLPAGLAGFLLGTLLILLPYELELSPTGVTTRSLLVTSRIGWDEVERVLTDKGQRGVALLGNRKTLATYGPASWRSSSAGEMRVLFSKELSSRGIVPERSQRALFLDTKNCRIQERT